MSDQDNPGGTSGGDYEVRAAEVERGDRPLVVDSFIDSDEKASRAAALAKLGDELPSKFAFADKKGDDYSVHDASRLTKSFSTKLLDRVVPQSDEGAHTETLRRIQRRLARVGMSVPSITVRFDHLSVKANARVGDSTVPTLVRPINDIITKVLPGRGSVEEVTILEDASGILRPGRFTLLLGPPSSGKSTWMRATIGQHPHGVHTSGELSFNGETLDRFVPQRAASYVHQHDEHYGELTVRETVDFAARVQSSGYEKHMLEDLVAREHELGIAPDPELDAYMKATAFGSRNNLIVELVLRLLGLDHVAETVVGNAMLRGISGGQKKRLGMAEALVGRARVLMADEISTGLDSNTTFSINRMLRDSTHIMGSTTVVSLLQPAPETVGLFDDVLLISSGMILWHGPIEGSLDIFSRAGLVCPPRLGAADFLQLVMIPSDQQRFWGVHGRPYEFVSARAIRDIYEASENFALVRKELDDSASWRIDGPVVQRARGLSRPEPGTAEAVAASLPRNRYGADVRAMLRANMKRAAIFELRNVAFLIIRFAQVLLMSFVMATLFIQIPKRTIADGNLIVGMIFYSLFAMFVISVQMSAMRLPVLYKQREARYYPPWTYSLGSFVFRTPFAILDATLWCLIIYFAVGMSVSARFFVFWLVVVSLHVWSITLQWFLGGFFQLESTALSFGAFVFLCVLCGSGFIVNYGYLPAWWYGAYWANPWSYLIQALAVNEFRSAEWQVINRDDPENPLTLGRQVLQFWTMHSGSRWVWIGVGTVLISIMINFLGYTIALTFLPPIHEAPVVSAGALEEHRFSRSSTDGAKVPDAIASDIATGAVRFARRVSSGKDIAAQGGGGAEVDAAAESGESSGGLKAETNDATAGSALPFEPLNMTFQDIEYSVPVPKGMDTSKADVPNEGPHANALRLLYKVNGALRPGVLTALMGASGAGKTTLMDVLAGRKTGGTITGDIRVNGFPKVSATFNRIAGYVEQTDVHMPQMTVQEALDFSAALRLPRSVDRAVGLRFVREIMGLVELDVLAHAHVGLPGQSGLSIQQRKRLTIAVELVANPSIIFLDEPTTGLDARAASIVMSTVRSVVNTGRTVVCTIHQPSLDIFEEFNELILLKPGGRSIFAGPVGYESQTLISYFQSIPGVKPIRDGVNPADWMLEQTNPHAEARLGIDFSAVFADSAVSAEVYRELAVVHEPPAGVSDLVYENLRGPPTKVQFKELLWRFFIVYWRAPDYNVSRAMVTILTGFAIGSIGWRQGAHRHAAPDILNIMGLMYQALLFLGWANCTSIMPLASLEREIMYRERAAGSYSAIAFGAAQLVVELPYLVVQSIVYSCIIYWMIYFIPDASKFFWFLCYVGFSLAVFTAAGAMCTNLLPTLSVCVLMAAVSFSMANLFAGFVIPPPRIRGWWIWAYYLNVVSYMLRGVIGSQLGDLDDEFIVDVSGNLVSIPEFLDATFGFKESHTNSNIGVLIAFLVVFVSLSIFALHRFNYQNR